MCFFLNRGCPKVVTIINDFNCLRSIFFTRAVPNFQYPTSMTCFHVFSCVFTLLFRWLPRCYPSIRRPVICWATCSRRLILGTAICVTEHILNHLCFQNIGKNIYSTFSAYQYSKVLPMQKVLCMICDGYLDNFCMLPPVCLKMEYLCWWLPSWWARSPGFWNF